jgi:tetratricopeptide (TPR) repeat protein
MIRQAQAWNSHPRLRQAGQSSQPADAEAYNNRGNVYDLIGNLERVIADYERVLEL